MFCCSFADACSVYTVENMARVTISSLPDALAEKQQEIDSLRELVQQLQQRLLESDSVTALATQLLIVLASERVQGWP